MESSISAVFVLNKYFTKHKGMFSNVWTLTCGMAVSALHKRQGQRNKQHSKQHLIIMYRMLVTWHAVLTTFYSHMKYIEFFGLLPSSIFLFATASRLALKPAYSPSQWKQEALTLGLKWPDREAQHSPPSSAELKNEESYTSVPPIRLNGVVLN
jgi:hypothetical protein